MGGSTTQTTAIKVANIQIQTSSYGLAKPVVYGTNRLAANLLWFGAFTATPHTTTTSQGGKGIGKVTSKDTTFTYSAAAILGLCEGPIAGIGSVWRDKDKTTLAALGLTLFTGTSTQAVWSYLTGYNVPGNWTYEQAYGYSGQAAAFTDQAINYSSTAYVAASAYDLGSNATVPNHGFEIQGKLIFGSGIVDASPAAIVPDMLTSTQYGAGMAAAQVGAMASYASYIQATGLFMSPTYESQRPTHDCLSELVDATNSAVVWSGGILNIIPYGDTALTGNGATYTPAVTPLFDFADDDFQGEDDPVRVTRSSPADAINRVQVEFLNRANQYNAEVVTVEDQDAIEKFGLKPASTLTLHMICNSATAKLAAQLYLQRMLYKRNTYEFDLDARYPMLEPMDVVTLTDAGQGMSRLPVRITEIAEKDDGFRITAEDLPIGIAHAAAYVHDNGLRWQSIINVTPQNCAAPIIFELPADPSISSAKGLSVAIAVGGQTNDPLYGGCRVWLSLDGTNYKAEGTIYGNSRYGLTTAILPAAAAGLDSTNTLSLGLRSNAQMVSGSAADRDKHTTLLNIGGEYLSFMTAALTGVNAYNVTSLNRALFGTSSASAKAVGSTFVYVDSRIAILKDLDLSLIGQTVYIKVTAFNTYGTGEQDISTVSAYNYTITGNMKALQTPVDFLTGVGGTTKPDLSATRGNTLIYNGGAESGTDGWIIDETTGTANTLAQSSVAEAISGSASFKMQKAATGDAFDIVGRKIAVVPGKLYMFKARIYGLSATSNGLYLRFNKASSNFVGDYITAATRLSTTDVLINGAITATVGSYELGFMASANDYYISPAIYNNAGGSLAIIIDDISFTEQLPWGTGIMIGFGKPENNATADDNMVSNGALIIDSSNWIVSGAVWTATAMLGSPSTGFFTFPATTVSSAIANNNAVRPLNGATTLFCSVVTWINTGATGAFTAQIDFYDATGALVSSSVNSIMQTTTNAWVPKIIPPIAVPTNAVSFIASFQRPSATGVVNATNLRIAKTQVAATVGSQVGVNLLDQAGTPIAVDSAIKNSAISINANGTLNGAGAGTAVSLTGIGYNGDVNATRNRYARQGTDPGYIEDGASWGDSSGVMARYKVRRSGAWDVGATDGAQVGGNLLDQSATPIATDAAIKNTSVTINANGTLSGAGGGTAVSLAGIAPNVDSYATSDDNMIMNGAIRVDSSSWYLAGGVARISGGASDPSTGVFSFPASAVSGAVANNNIARALNGATTIFFSGNNYTPTGTTGTFSIEIDYYNTAGTLLASAVVSILQTTTNTWLPFASNSTVPAGASSFVASFQRASGTGVHFATNLRVAKTQAAATIGADTTNLNVTIGGGNLVKNSSFEGPTYAGAVGTLPSGFALYCNSEIATTTNSIVAGRTSGSAMQVAWTANTSTKGFYFVSGGGVDNSLMFQSNTTMMLSYYVKATGAAVGQQMQQGWNNAPTTVTAVLNPPLTTGWQRYVFRLLWGAVVDGNGYVTIALGTANGTATIVFDDVQVEMGDTVTAYGANGVARIGSNLYDTGNLPIATDGAIKNSSVTMGSNGVLGGTSGGGAITALPADNLVDGSIYGRYALLERIKLGGVETGATTGDNLIANGGAELGTVGWTIDPTFGGNPLIASTVQKRSGTSSFLLNKAAVANSTAAVSNAISVNPGDIYTFTFWNYAGAAFGSGMYFSAYMKAAFPAGGSINRTNFDNYNDFAANSGAAIGVSLNTYTYTIPAGMFWMSVGVLSYINCDVNLYFEVTVQRQIAWQANIGGTGKPFDYATVGARVGVNFLDQGGVQVATDAAFKNNAITINANGTLTGAGGGTAVSLAGIGAGALATKNSVDPSTNDVRAIGAVPPAITGLTFTYTSTASAVIISWSAATIYRTDGTTIALSSGSQGITTLASGTSYRVYMYMADTGLTTGTLSFVLDSTNATGSPAYAFASTGFAAAAATMYGRSNIPLNAVTVATTVSGIGGGSGGGGIGCVDVESFMPCGKLAGQMQLGDALCLLSDDEQGWFDGMVERASAIYQPCSRITTESGITLVSSDSTPITCRGGSVVWLPDSLGVEVPVLDNGVFRWEKIIGLSAVGHRQVARISARNGTYAAGENGDGRYIFTHNSTFKP